MKRVQWKKPERDLERPLEKRGFAQAEHLVPMLLAFGVDSVHSSDATRCLQTVRRCQAMRRAADASACASPVHYAAFTRSTGHAS